MALAPHQKNWLTNLFGNRVTFDVSMAQYTTLRVGGKADALAAPAHIDELTQLMRWCGKNGIPSLVLGGGTNLLIKDTGYRGIVIAMTKAISLIEEKSRQNETVFVSAMAGANLQRLCRFAARNGLSGMQFATGIPGSVGGAIAMNAGTRDGSMQDVVMELTVLTPDGTLKNLQREALDFNYRGLAWQPALCDPGTGQTPLIVDSGIRLTQGDPETVSKEMENKLAERRANQPTKLPSAGCFFKNPAQGPPAGHLIDAAGLKGKKIGGAQISSVHANFIVNKEQATATDILELMETVQTAVFKQFNIQLEPEVKIVG